MRPHPIVSQLACLLLIGVASPPVAAQEDAERLSPLDSLRVAVGTAEIEVRYGRPSMRGRVIFGDLVPYGRVWRTGANEATQLSTDADLLLGEHRLPAGRYSLFTIPDRAGWTLIVNRLSDQWGTQYDPDRDVARIPMDVERLNRPVETFTISVVPTGVEEAEAVLRLEWERTRASVAIRVPPP